MGREKSRRARQAAEALFSGLKRTAGSSSSIRENPFGDTFDDSDDVGAEDEDDIFRLVPFPRAIEVPPGYESVEHVREAMRRAWRIDWHAFHADTVEVSLPYGWGVERPDGGPAEVYGAMALRAIFGKAATAELRLLPRYRLESQEDTRDGHFRIIVRDREYNGGILEASYWAPQSGQNHPDWNRMMAWLDEKYPLHRDPLRYWEDCEENIKTWDELRHG